MVVESKFEIYAEKHTKKPSLELQEIAALSRHFENGHMVSGSVESMLLKLLITISQAQFVLDIGMYTGYSALSMAEALPDNGRVITLESNPERYPQAQSAFLKSSHGYKIEVKMGAAYESMRSFSPESFDFIFIDADKGSYPLYYEKSLELVKPGGLIVLDNMMWQGTVLAAADKGSSIIHSLNETITLDSRVDNVLLTVRDGIQIVRKR